MNCYLVCQYRRAVHGRDYPEILHDCMTFPNPEKDPTSLDRCLKRAKVLASLGYKSVEPVLIKQVGKILN